MIYLKTDEEVELLRKANLLVSNTLAELAKVIEPGVTTKKLDTLAETYIRDNGAIPTFKGFPNPNGTPFPASICASVNDQVVHGIPNDVVLKEGDIVSIDCGTLLDGYCGDSCYTFAVGEIADDVRHLLDVTKQSLYLGIEQAVVGKRLGDISYAIQNCCESNGFGVVREFVGHGIGRDMHEDPQVPNYGKRGNGILLKNGLCIAIEPMITMGKRDIYLQQDGWGVVTRDHLPAAHFEHTVCVRKGKADILSSFEIIEKVLQDKSI
ncbi:MAG: type I methionyl aminopeptidase [Bacteroidaceae bacterium]|nr:type I methionyl aminopeptidase [Bacteroidaceae bacterium]